MKRIVLYIRVEESKEGFASGLKTVQRVHDGLKGKDAELVETYVDFKGEESRVARTQMLKDANDGKFDLIVTESTKMLDRQPIKRMPLIKDLLLKNIEVYFYDIGVNILDHTEQIELMLYEPKIKDWGAYKRKKNRK